MKSRTRLALECLEDRWCPALTATLASGTLTITGAADTAVNITQDSTTPGTINVLDGSSAVSDSPFTGVTSIRLNLTSADDDVHIDLGGQTFTGNVVANLGGGADSVTLLNGSIDGNLAVVADATGGGPGQPDHGGPGGGPGGHAPNDGFAPPGFGGPPASAPNGNFAPPGLRGPGGPGHNGTPPVTDTGADTVTIEAGTTVNNLLLRSGQAGGTFDIAGDVAGDLKVDAGSRTGSTAGTTVNVTGQVDGNVCLTGSNQDDVFTINGDVGGGVKINSGGGADKVSIGAAVTDDLFIDSGAGNDAITLSDVVGGRARVNAGAGDDSLTVTATAQFLDNA